MNGHKYNASKCMCNSGHLHDSKKEAGRCDELNLLELSGQISDLKTSVKYELVPAQYKEVDGKKKLAERGVDYIADFTYMENGKLVVEDVKGYRAGGAYNLFKLKKKLFLFKFGIEIKET